MNDRFEVVRTTQEQWHARYLSNGRIIFSSENYRRKIGAEKAILCVAHGLGWGYLALIPNTDNEKVFVDEWLELAPGLPTVLYVDDRLHPVKRPDLPDPGSLSA